MSSCLVDLVPAPVRVRFAASTDLVRAGLEVMLEPHRARVELHAWAAGGPVDVELVDVGREHGADVGVDGPRRPRLVLMWDASPRTAYRAEQLGATRVLPIDTSVDAVVDVLVRMARTASLRPAVVAGPGPGTSTVGSPLSAREAQVVSRICHGHTNNEIAEELFLSIDTVKSHVRTAYRKMGVANRAQAVLWGVEHGY